ncbi:unnamed protein product [Schistosoma turkestanicum]|nr:unnamed protein product [Schistosoma turkestanicum]
MSLSNDPYYCHEQIQIPPALPDILKQFTKAAIRTQPKDVLKWSHAYFKAIAQNEVPPVKMRLELPISTQKTDTGLTPGLLRILNNQTLSDTLKLICEVLTADPEGGAARLPFEQWTEFYRYLAKIDDIPDEHINKVLAYLNFDIATQNGAIAPRNFMHKNCPKLNPSEEANVIVFTESIAEN